MFRSLALIKGIWLSLELSFNEIFKHFENFGFRRVSWCKNILQFQLLYAILNSFLKSLKDFENFGFSRLHGVKIFCNLSFCMLSLILSWPYVRPFWWTYKIAFMFYSCVVIILLNTDLYKSMFSTYSFKSQAFRLPVFCVFVCSVFKFDVIFKSLL